MVCMVLEGPRAGDRQRGLGLCGSFCDSSGGGSGGCRGTGDVVGWGKSSLGCLPAFYFVKYIMS